MSIDNPPPSEGGIEAAALPRPAATRRLLSWTTTWVSEILEDKQAITRITMVAVPVLLLSSSLIMSVAWLGHLRFKQLPFWWALLSCWLLVLPEYLFNTLAIRMGKGIYTGAQMASFRLCSGVLCVAMVSHFFLGESFSTRQSVGFGLMILAMALIAKKNPSPIDEEQTDREVV